MLIAISEWVHNKYKTINIRYFSLFAVVNKGVVFPSDLFLFYLCTLLILLDKLFGNFHNFGIFKEVGSTFSLEERDGW